MVKVEDWEGMDVSECAMRDAGYGRGDAGHDRPVGTGRFPPNRSSDVRLPPGIMDSMGTLSQNGRSFL